MNLKNKKKETDMIKIIIKHTKPVPADVGRNDYFNHQRLHLTIMLK